jgi:RNA polymerase sigma-70 factor, ECF subfamily
VAVVAVIAIVPSMGRGWADFRVLLAAAADGDGAALGEVWQRHQPSLLRYLRGRGCIDFEDVASQVWIDVARGLPDFTGGEPDFRRWLYTIAHHRYVDEVRRHDRRTRAESAEAPRVVETAHDNTELDAALLLIRRLPPDMAEAVLLRIIADLSVADVAEIMGKRDGTVRVLVHRGLQRLGSMIPPRVESLEIGVTHGRSRSLYGVK